MWGTTFSEKLENRDRKSVEVGRLSFCFYSDGFFVDDDSFLLCSFSLALSALVIVILRLVRFEKILLQASEKLKN